MKLHEIIPGKLYQRGEFQNHAGRVALLRAKNIHVIVSMYGEPDPVLQGNGFTYIHLPIPDGKLDDPKPLLDAALRAYRMMRLMDCAALVHCHAGRNRSGLVSALIVRHVLKCTGAEARRLVQHRRPNALANPHFCAYLDSLGAP